MTESEDYCSLAYNQRSALLGVHTFLKNPYPAVLITHVCKAGHTDQSRPGLLTSADAAFETRPSSFLGGRLRVGIGSSFWRVGGATAAPLAILYVWATCKPLRALRCI